MAQPSLLRRYFVMLGLLFSSMAVLLVHSEELKAQDTAPDSILNVSTGVFHPGRATFVSVQLKIHEDRDLLIDYLDKTGWYTGTRRHVKAGTDYISTTLELPVSMQDPASAYVSVKIIPVGGEWTQKLSELNLPVRMVTAQTIPVPLHYNFPLSTLSEPVGRGFSNHDGVRVFVRKSSDTYEMGFSQSGYGQEQDMILDLVTGDLNVRVKNSMNVTDQSTLAADAIAQDEQAKQLYVQHLTRMKGNFEHVESGRMADLSGDYPLLREANDYLRKVLLSLKPIARDAIEAPVLHNTGGGPSITPRPGKKIAVKVRYEASAERDLVLVVKAEGRELLTQTFKVGPGADTLVLPFALPKDAPTEAAIFTVALVPTGAGLEATLARAEKQADILAPNNLDGVFAADRVDSLDELYMSVNYATVEPLDLRVDLYDPNGTRLDRIQYPLEVSDSGTVYPLQFSTSHPLESGRTYTLVFRLVPPGSTSEDGFGEVVKFFQKRDVN